MLINGCKKKSPSELKVHREKEKQKIREQLEESIKKDKLKLMELKVLKKDGLNDSFFRGEEFKNLEEVNPNINMQFDRFRFEPDPDFTVRYASNNAKL